MQNEYVSQIKIYEADRQKNNQYYNALGYAKLLFAVLICILIYLFYTRGYSLILIVSVVFSLTVFVALWLFQMNIRSRIDYAAGIITICQRQIDRINGKWGDFEDKGAEFINSNHPFAGDLDIVGPKSLFQFLNTSHTWHGRQAFVSDLLYPERIRHKQAERLAAVAELSQDILFSQHIQYYFSKIGVDKTAPQFVAELKEKKIFLKSKTLKLTITRIPVLTVLALAAAGIFQRDFLFLISLGLIFLQLILWICGTPLTLKYLRTVSGLSQKLSSYSDVIDVIGNRKFQSEALLRIQEQLAHSGSSAAQAMKELGQISDRVRVRHHGILHFILNVLLLWDFDCSVRYEEWKIKYAHLVQNWFFVLGEFESMLCFSHLPNVCDHTCQPSISTIPQVTALKLGHPLIPNDIRVNNDLTLRDHIFIISGSNMSGKTTFLRTLGINLVLASAGSFVCAEQMTCSQFDIITSMRIADDLNQGISTFYAEITRIKTIIDAARENSQVFFLIDEIFRGTNSSDRLTGAKTILTKLNTFGVNGMISTHDLELCELSKTNNRIKNYSFSEYYENDSIHFDYRMKPGKSQTTNAKYLMRLAGIT